MSNATHRIRRGIKPYGGRPFIAKVTDGILVTGYVVTTYKNRGPYAYRADELEELKP